MRKTLSLTLIPHLPRFKLPINHCFATALTIALESLGYSISRDQALELQCFHNQMESLNADTFLPPHFKAYYGIHEIHSAGKTCVHQLTKPKSPTLIFACLIERRTAHCWAIIPEQDTFKLYNDTTTPGFHQRSTWAEIQDLLNAATVDGLPLASDPNQGWKQVVLNSG